MCMMNVKKLQRISKFTGFEPESASPWWVTSLHVTMTSCLKGVWSLWHFVERVTLENFRRIVKLSQIVYTHQLFVRNLEKLISTKRSASWKMKPLNQTLLMSSKYQEINKTVSLFQPVNLTIVRYDNAAMLLSITEEQWTWDLCKDDGVRVGRSRTSNHKPRY